VINDVVLTIFGVDTVVSRPADPAHRRRV
jgi:hypothetical protein